MVFKQDSSTRVKLVILSEFRAFYPNNVLAIISSLFGAGTWNSSLSAAWPPPPRIPVSREADAVTLMALAPPNQAALSMAMMVPSSFSALWTAPFIIFCHVFVRFLLPVITFPLGGTWAAPLPGPATVLILAAHPPTPLWVLAKGRVGLIRRRVHVPISFPKFIVGISEYMKKVAVFSSGALFSFK